MHEFVLKFFNVFLDLCIDCKYFNQKIYPQSYNIQFLLCEPGLMKMRNNSNLFFCNLHAIYTQELILACIRYARVWRAYNM